MSWWKCFPCSQPHYSKMQPPFAEPNLTAFIEHSTHWQWKLPKVRMSSKARYLRPQPWSSGARTGQQHCTCANCPLQKWDSGNHVSFLPKQQGCTCTQGAKATSHSLCKGEGPRRATLITLDLVFTVCQADLPRKRVWILV
jgi:hypothetical protein